MSKRLKAISPLVAVIMLIAFTLIVAGILAGWATQFARQQTSSIQRCVDARVLLQRARYEPSDDSMLLVIYNSGKVDLNFDVFLRYSNTTAHPQAQEKYPGQVRVNASKIKSFTLSSPYNNGEADVNITDDLSSITIQSADCDPPCYHCAGTQDTMLDIYIEGL